MCCSNAWQRYPLPLHLVTQILHLWTIWAAWSAIWFNVWWQPFQNELAGSCKAHQHLNTAYCARYCNSQAHWTEQVSFLICQTYLLGSMPLQRAVPIFLARGALVQACSQAALCVFDTPTLAVIARGRNQWLPLLPRSPVGERAERTAAVVHRAGSRLGPGKYKRVLGEWLHTEGFLP